MLHFCKLSFKIAFRFFKHLMWSPSMWSPSMWVSEASKIQHRFHTALRDADPKKNPTWTNFWCFVMRSSTSEGSRNHSFRLSVHLILKSCECFWHMELTQFESIWPIRPITKWIPLRRVFCFLDFASVFFFKSRCGLGCSWSGGLKQGGGVLEELNFQDQNHQSFYMLMLMLNWSSLAGRWSDSFWFFN